MKKLIRNGKKFLERFGSTELETISNQDELNNLYILKIKEELEEIKNSQFKDLNEFADLLQVVTSFAIANGFSEEELTVAKDEKAYQRGEFGNIALINLNPNNPSNKIYFNEV
jgi:predicted house-cleaning noncanonical NTP pyrophosphatase (MazG superfamily)